MDVWDNWMGWAVRWAGAWLQGLGQIAAAADKRGADAKRGEPA
jgi:hypothetical protein